MGFELHNDIPFRGLQPLATCSHSLSRPHTYVCHAVFSCAHVLWNLAFALVQTLSAEYGHHVFPGLMAQLQVTEFST